MNKIFSFFKTFSRLLIISILIGLFVASFQYISYQLGIFLKDVFVNKEPIKIAIFFTLIPSVIYLSYFMVTNNRNIIGGGIPALEYNLKNRKERLNPKKDLPMMALSALCTTCTYACLGTVLATSIVMGGNLALLVNEYFKVEDDDSVNIAMGASFGAMLLHPIPGFVYCFEEALKKINFKLVIKSLFMCLISFGVSYLVFRYKTFYIEVKAFLNLSHWYIFLIIQIAAFIFSTTFVHLIIVIKKLSARNKQNFFSKYRMIIFLIFMIPLGFLFGNYLGSGVGYIKFIFNENTWYILIIFL